VTAQLALSPSWGRSSRLARAFDDFDRANPEVWALFVRFAEEVLRAGLHHYSADAILHRIRWHVAIETRVSPGYKINDHHSAYFARKWQRLYPQHAGLFATREVQT
jgi:hypothetical protein